MKKVKVDPYVPYYAANGNTILRTWEEFFEDRNGNKAILTKCEYRTKKKEELNEAVMRVKWL